MKLKNDKRKLLPGNNKNCDCRKQSINNQMFVDHQGALKLYYYDMFAYICESWRLFLNLICKFYLKVQSCKIDKIMEQTQQILVNLKCKIQSCILCKLKFIRIEIS
jgi:hypothetical protein